MIFDKLKEMYNGLAVLIIVLFVGLIIWSVIDALKPPISEFTFYEYSIDYDDDKRQYDVFADNEHWLIPERRVEIIPITDYESYIIIQQYGKQQYNLTIFINIQQRRHCDNAED